ncbi:MAG TPA: alpha-hydroxy acid oxidase [Bryobacteraceae bacterium]|nr:alpha-hydroxy acid oxidase [Bryobacteraceae bacterium]
MICSLQYRRQFLRFLAASPVAALSAWQAQKEPGVLSDPKDALNVIEFEAAARRAIPPAHFGYMATGVDDDATIQANRDGFKRIQLRPRRMRDVSHVDMRTELFGTTWDFPIFICPTGSQRAFHPDGELATARAARSKKALQILSTVTTTSVEDVAQALGRPPWYQLYPTSRWEVTEKLVKRAEAAGCPALVLTVDNSAGRHVETQLRFRLLDSRPCASCHPAAPGATYRRKPMFDGIDMAGVGTQNAAMTWEFVDRLKKLTPMKLLIKGIETGEDAALCREHGADGIVVSNHGGRAEESGRGTIECLPEVIDAAAGKIPVLIDGGFRRGTDVFKALALGATAVGIGRPYLWGLGAFGQAGVERVLDLLRNELQLIMKQCGTRSIAEIGRASIVMRGSA